MQSESYLLTLPEALEKEKKRLVRQAEVLFELEKSAFDRLGISPRSNDEKKILDLGSGNGAYTELLRNHFRSDDTFGFERNEKLIEQSRSLYPNLKLVKGDLLDTPTLLGALEQVGPDYVNLRFVLQHLTPEGRRHILTDLRAGMKPGSNLVIIEPDDSKILKSFQSETVEHLINRTIELQKSRGGDRTIGSKLSSELLNAGFSSVEVRETALKAQTHGLPIFEEIILPIWRSYANINEKTEIDHLVDLAKNEIEKAAKTPGFTLEFPIFVFRVNL